MCLLLAAHTGTARSSCSNSAARHPLHLCATRLQFEARQFIRACILQFVLPKQVRQQLVGRSHAHHHLACKLPSSVLLLQVGGRKFHAHRLALLAASDTFRAMFDGEYKERNAPLIPIPNIRYEVCFPSRALSKLTDS